MRLLRRRSRFEQVVKVAGDAKLPSGVGSLADIHAPKAVKSGATVVAATASSAAISALRRRVEDSSSDR